MRCRSEYAHVICRVIQKWKNGISSSSAAARDSGRGTKESGLIDMEWSEAIVEA